MYVYMCAHYYDLCTSACQCHLAQNMNVEKTKNVENRLEQHNVYGSVHEFLML